MPAPQSRFLDHLAQLQAEGHSGGTIAQMLRLPRAEAERLGLVQRLSWSHLAWRLAANRLRWQRSHWR